MRRTIITCKTIGPMFMSGGDKDVVEIRASSIKGVMRFFWRAAQCASDLSKLKEKEDALFGSVSKDARASRMRLSVRSKGKVSSERADLLPHRKLVNGKLAFSQAAKVGTLFDVIISTKPTDEEFHDQFVRLFILTTILGGFGKRSRKGMGTLEIQNVVDSADNTFDFSHDAQNLCSLLNSISVLNNATYIKDRDGITAKTTNSPIKYPYIKKISVSTKSYTSSIKTAEVINLMAHNAKKENKRANFIGASGKERFSSPIICSSVRKDGKYVCIVTELNNTKYRESENELRKKFLSEIL